jgi:integrase
MSVYKRIRNGTESATWWINCYYAGRQIRRNTGMTTKPDAEKYERNFLKALAAGRAEQVQALALRASAASAATLGQIRAAYEQIAAPSLAHETLLENLAAMGRFLRATQPQAKDLWALSSLDALTPEAVRRYQHQVLAAAGPDELARESAKRTANSVLRAVRSWFKRAWLPAYAERGVTLPDLSAFREVPPLPAMQKQYAYNAALVDRTLQNAVQAGPDRWGADQPALRAQDPAAYLAYLLSVGLGLRPGESRQARWSWFQTTPQGRVLCTIAATDTWRGPKGKRERSVPVEPFIWAELERARVPVVGGAPDYVIPGPREERIERCWTRLGQWMHRQGWDTRLKGHELRKAYGAKVATSVGLYAAQKLLGHANPSTTSQYYASLVDLPDVRIYGPPAAAPRAAVVG